MDWYQVRRCRHSAKRVRLDPLALTGEARANGHSSNGVGAVRPYVSTSKPVLDASAWEPHTLNPSTQLYPRTQPMPVVPNRLRLFSGTANPVGCGLDLLQESK